ncbi:MAG: DNA repair protein RecN [Chloroflexi bacterium]|nr:DNA repair protein RecN [Chloroflexota bacterium]
MLERLRVSDFAVARSVELCPAAGLTVFTGETGAGKSLIVDALAFVFGGRRGREVIAAGSERATVAAEVALPEGRAMVERSIGLSGRSAARIDGEPATVEQLQALAGRLVDIHGQAEQLAILKPGVQLAILDESAGLTGLQSQVAAIAHELRDVRRDLRTLATDARGRERLIDQLRFEVDEISEAGLVPGEDEGLRAEQARLAGAGRIRESVAMAMEALDAAPLGEAVRAVEEIVGRDADAAELADLGALLETSAEDLTRALRRYREGIEEDPERLAAIEERLDLVARLRRKYGDGVDEILAYLREAEEKLAALTSNETSIEALTAREVELLAGLAAKAGELSLARRAAAGDLVRAIARELEHLGMAGAALSVGFGCEDDADGPLVALPDYEVVVTERPGAEELEALPRAFTETGVDRVEFLASFNAGETPRPLSAVASGGETSRFLLALTAVLGSAAEHRLIVFDEVDEGVGGRAGGLVGAALARLAQRHQVLCITHLPQVAAFGERHFVVTKKSDGSRTWSEVDELRGAARIDELAAMLGTITDATRRTARELLAAAGV